MLGRARLQRRECGHIDTMSVTAAGVERTVCESCGHVSFKFMHDATPEIAIQRAMFARDIERESEVEREPQLVGVA